MPAPWASRPAARDRPASQERRARPRRACRSQALRTALGISAEAAGLPGALVKTLNRGVRNETSALSLYAPRTILNQPITGSRRFAAQDWPIERLRAIGKATGTTLNDVVLAMCSGAMRTYLARARRAARHAAGRDGAGRAQGQAVAASPPPTGGNAVGAVMVQARHRPRRPGRPAAGRSTTRWSTARRRSAEMTPVQILAMSALGQAPAILGADAAGCRASCGRRTT